MSEIARELKLLYYLDNKRKLNKYSSIKELAKELDISERQVRRYRDDLEQAGYFIQEKRGPGGGYMLLESINQSLMIPENIMLAISISARTNESLFSTLNSLPVVPKINKYIYGDTTISNDELKLLEVICMALKDSKIIKFKYETNYKTQYNYDFIVKPYKIIYTNHTYYLKGVNTYKNDIRTFDINKISDIITCESFEVDKLIEEKINNDLDVFGIWNQGDIKTLELEYFNNKDEQTIDRFFEYKGEFNHENKIYKVNVRDSVECLIAIFSLYDKVKIKDDYFKNKYKEYLKKELAKLN